MGDVFSTEKMAQYLDTLEMVDTRREENFGVVDVFRSREAPYEYVMDYKKAFADGDERLSRYLQLMGRLQAVEHKNLVRVHLCELREEHNMCIKDRRVHVFCNYYNFTLQRAVSKKKVSSLAFPQSQLLYVFASLVDLSHTLSKHSLLVGDFRTDRIYISPEGYVKLYLLELEDHNRHTAYYRALVDKDLVSELILAPEQLQELQQMKYSISYDQYKADLFAIAMVILELITLDKTRFYYNEQRTELRMGKIEYSLSAYEKIYSDPFLNLLKHCLQPHPTNRPTLGEAHEAVAQLRAAPNGRAVSYCIRLSDDDEKNKRQVVPQASLHSKGLHILNGLERRLMPGPISTLSTMSTNSLSPTGSVKPPAKPLSIARTSIHS